MIVRSEVVRLAGKQISMVKGKRLFPPLSGGVVIKIFQHKKPMVAELKTFVLTAANKHVKKNGFMEESFAGVAQPVEQLICNQQVAGSSPIASSRCGGVPEWPKGADCKSVGSAFGGSNPPPSTRLPGHKRQSGCATRE